MERDLSRLRIDPAARGPRGTNRRLIAAIVIVAVVVVAAAFAVQMRGRPVEVSVAMARAASASAGQNTVLNASGYVTPRRRATVAAKITGKIQEVLIDEGTRVQAGDVLARLEDVEARAALRAAQADHAVATAALADTEARLANARRTRDRNRQLREAGAVSIETLDETETLVASLEAQQALAKERINAAARAADIARQGLESCTIRAPFAGVIVSKDAQPGEMVSPISAGGGYTRTGIATIVDMASLEVEVDVGESYIARVTPGQRVETTLDAYPEWRIASQVRTVIPTADRQKATVKVRIAFDALDPRILPDMGVKVSFLEGAADTSAADAVLVPREAVRAESETAVVFVIREERAERRAVRTGRERGAEIEIVAGLRPGEAVATSALDRLEDNARVTRR